MRVSSVGLEVSAFISEDELAMLGRREQLSGLMKAYPIEAEVDNYRNIPVIFRRANLRRFFIDCKIFPEHTYFPEAERLEFLIGSDYYECLRKHLRAHERLGYLAPQGKLLMRVRTATENLI